MLRPVAGAARRRRASLSPAYISDLTYIGPVRAGTAGNLTTDAHLADLAISYGAVLVSFDTDFSRFKGLRWEAPDA